MRVVDIIMKKRGSKTQSPQELSRAELEFLIKGYVSKTIPEYQISAWLMAVFFNGMTFDETAILTELMLNSGKAMDLSGIQGPFVDKHSTGGVGDKISLPLAPLVAACGVKVPMMSGRALGHTGGTLDKLESITGYKTQLTVAQFRDFIEKDNFAMTGQTEEIVPADRLLYALRDVTATVESVPLITSSILSKKVAEGADSLVFDVKCGAGAFMKKIEDAEQLAKMLVGTGTTMGKKIVALITNMEEPLGNKVGNFLEIEETMDILEGKGPYDTTELTLQFASWMIWLGGKASSKEEGRKKAEEAIHSGRAMECFLRNVDRQGGKSETLLAERGNRRSSYHTRLIAEEEGFIKTINAFEVGRAGVYLGVGRNKTTDAVCPDAGIELHKHTGEAIKKGDVIMDLYGKDSDCLPVAEKILKDAITYTQKVEAKKPLIFKEITQV